MPTTFARLTFAKMSFGALLSLGVLRRIYTSDFRARFPNKLVHFRVQKYIVCVVNLLA